MQDATVVAAVDPDPKRRESVSAMFPGIRTEADYKRVLEDQAVDAVVVATPTRTHYEIVRDALLADKHVLCEKPLCEISAQAQELSELGRVRKLALMVGHVFLFNPGLVEVKKLVDAGELGGLQYMTANRTNLGPIRSDVNAAYDLASHDISIFNWLLGSVPETVCATGAAFLQPGVEDVVFITLKYPANVFATIGASWLSPKKVRQITVVGKQKMVTWDDLELNTPVAIYNKGANAKQEYSDFGEFLRVSTWEGDVRLPKVDFDEPLKVQARYFLEAIGKGKVEHSDGFFALGVVESLEAVAESLRSDGTPVSVQS
jgi:predicted dehydrogenase